MQDFSLPISTLNLVGPTYTSALARLEIYTIRDLLFHFPVRYDDLTQKHTISRLEVGQKASLSGFLEGIRSVRLRSGKTMQQATFYDDTGSIDISWFNQPYLVKTFQTNNQVNLIGKVALYRGKLTLTSPQYELLKAQTAATRLIHSDRLVPQYRQTAGISSKWLRSRISSLIHQPDFTYPDPLPNNIIQKHQLLSLTQALQHIHFPKSQDQLDQSVKRLSYDELLHHQLASQLLKNEWSSKSTTYSFTDQSHLAATIQQLPFQLTSAQKRVVNEILTDMAASTPMHRLLQGDVGSGKTVVAGIAALTSVKNGHPAIFMAPTEVLALQHAHSLKKLFGKQGITVSTQTGSVKEELKHADIIVGTHALLHRQMPNNIGLVIIDEQHRFGVEQRAQLLEQPITPHLLSMTATPIPRTIALTLYAQLDVSIIDEMPPGRQQVKTWVVPQKKKSASYGWIKSQIQQHAAQVFVVCPLIEASISPLMDQVKAVEEEFSHLQKEFSEYSIDLLHGRLPNKQKNQVLNQFRQGETQILVTTPVIEVGVDIPQATIILIESAERFGLASLHQLRGRVGRSDKPSYCLLFCSTNTTSTDRIKHLETLHQGLALAEIDLKLRGPGNLFGTAQSGIIDLKIASLNDAALITTTHADAVNMAPNMQQYPELLAAVEAVLEKTRKAD